ncbi:Uncharacterised protein [Achromobacter sp. 2789STDY5608615]|nr:Uncharacterised protein [Achromobacter sp. 2789STDY5608615]
MPSRNHALVSRNPQRRPRRPAWRLAPLTQALAVLLVAGGRAWRGAGPGAGVQPGLVRRQGGGAIDGAAHRPHARRQPGRHRQHGPPAGAIAPAAAALAGQPEPHRGGGGRAAGGAGGGARGRQWRGGAGRPGAGRPVDRRRRAGQVGRRQEADHRHRGRTPAGDDRADAIARHPELGHVQHRPQHHAAVQAGRRRRGAEPGSGRVGPAQPDPGRDQGRRHGAGGQPERRDLQRYQPGQRAQPGGRGRDHDGCAVPRARHLRRRRRHHPDLQGRARQHRGAGRRAPVHGHARQRHARRRLCAAGRQGSPQRRRDQHAAGPGAAGGGRQFHHPPRPGIGQQHRLHHARQRGADDRRRAGAQHRPDPGAAGRHHPDRAARGAGRRAGVDDVGGRARHHPPGRARRWRGRDAERIRHQRHPGGRQPDDGAGRPARQPAAAGRGRQHRAHPRRRIPPRPVAAAHQQPGHGGLPGRFAVAGHRRAGGGQGRWPRAGARRRAHRRGRRGRRDRVDGVQQPQDQPAGQRTARRPDQPRQQAAEQQRRLARSPRPGAPGGGQRRQRCRPLVHGRRAAGSGRLPGHAGRAGEPLAGAGRRGALRWRRGGDAGRLGHQPVGRHARRAERRDPPELAARRGRPPVPGRSRAGRPALYRPVPGLRGGVATLGRERHAALLQPADRAADPLRVGLHRGPRCRHAGGLDSQRGAGRRPDQRHLPGRPPDARAGDRPGRLQPVASQRGARGAVRGGRLQAVLRHRRQLPALPAGRDRHGRRCGGGQGPGGPFGRPGTGRCAAGGPAGQAVPGRRPPERLRPGRGAHRRRPQPERGRHPAQRRWRRDHAVCAHHRHQRRPGQPRRPDPGRQYAAPARRGGPRRRGRAGAGRRRPRRAARGGRRGARCPRRVEQPEARPGRAARPGAGRWRPRAAARHRRRDPGGGQRDRCVLGRGVADDRRGAGRPRRQRDAGGQRARRPDRIGRQAVAGRRGARLRHERQRRPERRQRRRHRPGRPGRWPACRRLAAGPGAVPVRLRQL